MCITALTFYFNSKSRPYSYFNNPTQYLEDILSEVDESEENVEELELLDLRIPSTSSSLLSDGELQRSSLNRRFFFDLKRQITIVLFYFRPVLCSY